MARKHLDDSEIVRRLAATDGWKSRGAAIARSFRFESYAKGVEFTNAVAAIAERLDHHPDIALGYGRVDVIFTTHDAGGVSARDFDAATEIDALAKTFVGIKSA